MCFRAGRRLRGDSGGRLGGGPDRQPQGVAPSRCVSFTLSTLRYDVDSRLLHVNRAATQRLLKYVSRTTVSQSETEDVGRKTCFLQRICCSLMCFMISANAESLIHLHVLQLGIKNSSYCPTIYYSLGSFHFFPNTNYIKDETATFNYFLIREQR